MQRIDEGRQSIGKWMVILLVGSMGFQAGCATRQGTATAWGAGIGTLAGAALGQAIGRDTEGTLIGAAAGAAAGSLAGVAVGTYMDEQERELRDALEEVDAVSVERERDVLAVTFKSDVSFDVDSAKLHPGSLDELERVSRVLNRYPDTHITVGGHTDSTGSEIYNQALSERRADAVRGAMVGRGVSASRVSTIGYGEARPIASNATESGRSRNRRVEILIAPRA